MIILNEKQVKSLIFVVSNRRFLSTALCIEYANKCGYELYRFKADMTTALIRNIHLIDELECLIECRLNNSKDMLLNRIIEVIRHYNDRSVYQKYVRVLSRAYARIDNLNLSAGA